MNFTKSVCGRLSLIHNGVELDGLYDPWNPSRTYPKPNTVIKPYNRGDSLLLWDDEEAVQVTYCAVEVDGGFIWEEVF